MDGQTIHDTLRLDKVKASPSSKISDLSDLNNWRGIILLDVGSKIVSIILNVRAQKSLQHDGHPTHFGSAPSTGCANSVFSLKRML